MKNFIIQFILVIIMISVITIGIAYVLEQTLRLIFHF